MNQIRSGMLTRFKAYWNVRRVLFVLGFMVAGLVAMRLNFSPVLGQDNQFFTLFQFFGPIAGAFLGPLGGIIAVLGTQGVDFLLVSKAFTAVNLLRLLPMLFAAYYFGTSKRNLSRAFTIAVPLACMALFIAHPVGSQAWIYSLYWLIPVTISMLPRKTRANTLLSALGSTFTAHAIGGALWIWTVPSTPDFWITLIPIVAYERTLFTIGITGAYIGMTPLLDRLAARFGRDEKNPLAVPVLWIERKFALRKAAQH